MLGRFPRLSRFATKILEIACAACASTLAAIVLGNSREPPRPPAPPPVVRLAPADEQMIRYVRDEGAALVEQLRSASDARSGSAIAPATAAPTPKPAKAASGAPMRREQKADRAQASEPRQRPGEPLPIQGAMALPAPEGARAPAGAGAASDTRDGRTTPAAAAAATESGLSSTPTRVPSRLWPAAASSLRDAPRPPLGVGEFLSSSM